MTVRCALVLVVAFGLFVAPANAAGQPVRKAIWGAATYAGKSEFPIYRDLGVSIYQFPVFWDQVAARRPEASTDPGDPAYSWPAELDFAVREAARTGIRVLIRTSGTPGWANGGRESSVPPTEPADYARFLVAMSRRYPTVRLWMVWVEPNRTPFYAIDGQSEEQRARGQALNARQRRQVGTYAQLLDESYVALKRRSKRNLIIGGNTTTTGDVNPQPFIRNMRLANGKPPRMDMFGHNPFGTRKPDLMKDPLQVGSADFSDLDDLVAWVDRSLGRGGRNRRLPIFVSEYTAPTDIASDQWPYHVTRQVQANWLRSGFGIVRAWRRVYALGWYTLRDPDPALDPVSGRNGLIDLQGRRKPAYFVYKHA